VPWHRAAPLTDWARAAKRLFSRDADYEPGGNFDREEFDAGRKDDPQSEPLGGVTEAPPSSKRKALSQRMADVEPKEVDWLWYPYFPRGFLTSVEGDPGVSKSTLMCEIAARISRGDPLPGQSGRGEPQNVLMLSAEDSLAVTLHKRLVAQEALGARGLSQIVSLHG
jgi:hypothetical protein